MRSNKLIPGEKLPNITVKALNGSALKVNEINNSDADWKLIIIYRGAHCPICTKYLNEIEEYKYLLLDIGIEIVAISADKKEQVTSHLKKLNVGFDIGYGMTLHQMNDIGVYQSLPKNEHETDHVFAEPALFVIDNKSTIQVVDITNNPFVRPDVHRLYEGLKFIRDPENNYPIRGTHYEPLPD